jgi:hypothetical protein
LFAQKVLGTARPADATGVSGFDHRHARRGERVPLKNGERVVGVFGLFEELPTTHPRRRTRISPPTSRGAPSSGAGPLRTKQIAAELHLSTETVRTHIRGVFRALGVNSRLSRRRRPGLTTPVIG